ncbi:MAG: hypothetical protein ACTSWN_07145, partial [Promethearchaeota archaeon]
MFRDRILSSAWPEIASILGYIEIHGDLTHENILPILKEFDIYTNLDELRIKSKWRHFKEINVYDISGQPAIFIKELWQPASFREILGIHIAQNYLDPELCPKTYRFGIWRVKGRSIPIIITSYVKGRSLKKSERQDYLYELGRQHSLHHVISLYDVDYRHFIVQQGILVRIDFGRSFSNLDMPYQGFWDFGFKSLSQDPMFREGTKKEFEIIKKNLSYGKEHLKYLFQKLYELGSIQNE